MALDSDARSGALERPLVDRQPDVAEPPLSGFGTMAAGVA
jgi:hypothetical protein